MDLTFTEADPSEMNEEFWGAFHSLNRLELFEKTVAYLRAAGKSLILSELARALPPTHDLESLVFWLAMARQAGVEVGNV